MNSGGGDGTEGTDLRDTLAAILAPANFTVEGPRCPWTEAATPSSQVSLELLENASLAC